MRIDSHGVREDQVRGVPHIGKGLFGGPRAEMRIANLGTSSPLLDPENSGALAIFVFRPGPGTPPTHTGPRAAPVSFLRVQKVLNGRRRATMADGDGERRRTLGQGTPGTPERHDQRLGRRTRLYPPPRAPGAN